MGRRLGLIVGVNSYQDATFRPLQYSETDARALAQWLVHNRGGKWNPADVQVVQGAEATRELVESLITQLCLQIATPGDMVLLYFAGYAFIDQVSGEGYLACYNTRYQQSGSGINLLALVSQIMARSPAAQIFCILDCFQSGSVWNMRRSSAFDFKPLLGQTVLNGLQQMQGRLLYCTCRGNDGLPEVGEKNLGSFMYRTIMGVGGPAIDPMNGQITLQRLHAFLTERLNEQHRPQVFGQETRPLVLVGDMPTFQTGALGGLNSTGGRPGTGGPGSPGGSMGGSMGFASGPLTAQSMQGNGYSVAQLSPTTSGIRPSQMGQFSPATSGLGQAALSTVEQNRMQQSQQMLSQAMQVFQAQNYEQAYQMAETILQMNPGFTDALILKAQTLAATNQFDEALNIVQETVQRDPESALAWSMAAALLANIGQLPEAMSAVDRSISIDPSNSETHSIKEMIREKLAEHQFDTGKRSRLQTSDRGLRRDTGKSLLQAVGLQVFALVLGVLGAFLPLLSPALPFIVSMALDSIALALLAVNAARGAFLYGIKRFLITFVCSLAAAALAAGLYFSIIRTTPLTHFLMDRLAVSYLLLTPLTVLVIWLATAVTIPLLVGLIGLIAGFVFRGAQKRK